MDLFILAVSLTLIIVAIALIALAVSATDMLRRRRGTEQDAKVLADSHEDLESDANTPFEP